MNKHERYYQKIEEFKQRFRNLSTETLRHRLGFGFLYKEAAIAYREILEERGEPLYAADEKSSETNEESGTT